MSSFWQYFDIQMAIFRRFRSDAWRDVWCGVICNSRLLLTDVIPPNSLSVPDNISNQHTWPTLDLINSSWIALTKTPIKLKLGRSIKDDHFSTADFNGIGCLEGRKKTRDDHRNLKVILLPSTLSELHLTNDTFPSFFPVHVFACAFTVSQWVQAHVSSTCTISDKHLELW